MLNQHLFLYVRRDRRRLVENMDIKVIEIFMKVVLKFCSKKKKNDIEIEKP